MDPACFIWKSRRWIQTVENKKMFIQFVPVGFLRAIANTRETDVDIVMSITCLMEKAYKKLELCEKFTSSA